MSAGINRDQQVKTTQDGRQLNASTRCALTHFASLVPDLHEGCLVQGNLLRPPRHDFWGSSQHTRQPSRPLLGPPLHKRLLCFPLSVSQFSPLSLALSLQARSSFLLPRLCLLCRPPRCLCVGRILPTVYFFSPRRVLLFRICGAASRGQHFSSALRNDIRKARAEVAGTQQCTPRI